MIKSVQSDRAQCNIGFAIPKCTPQVAKAAHDTYKLETLFRKHYKAVFSPAMCEVARRGTKPSKELLFPSLASIERG